MTTKDEAMKQARNFILATGEHDQRCGAFDLDEEGRHCACTCGLRKTIDALRTAIEQMEKQEPVAWMWKDGTITSDPDRADGTWTPLYTSPQPSKPWVGLTEEEIDMIYTGIRAVHHDIDSYVFARAIEAKLKEKNT